MKYSNPIAWSLRLHWLRNPLPHSVITQRQSIANNLQRTSGVIRVLIFQNIELSPCCVWTTNTFRVCTAGCWSNCDMVVDRPVRLYGGNSTKNVLPFVVHFAMNLNTGIPIKARCAWHNLNNVGLCYCPTFGTVAMVWFWLVGRYDW